MRYFYAIGLHGAKSKAPVDEVQKCFNRALHAASIAAAYRHPKLSAVKHLEKTHSIDGISTNATPEELRAEIAKRVVLLRDKGYVDLEALQARVWGAIPMRCPRPLRCKLIIQRAR